MRVIAGERKGVRLLPPGKNERTRPTEDKTKEAVFSILQPLLQGARVMDLFAGTGQMGIEFLSRGASFAFFCEKSRPMARTLRDNLEKTRYKDVSMVYSGDYRQAVAQSEGVFDYVYLDPPFGFGMEETAVEMLRRLGKVAPGGLIILETGVEPGAGERRRGKKVAGRPKTEDADENTEEPKDESETQWFGYHLIFDRTYRSQRIRIYKEEA